MNFHVLNCYDHIYEAIRSSSWKIMLFEPKMFRAAQNHQKWTCFLLNRFLKLFKTVFKTATFQKILDGDLRKIAKCSLKMKIYEVLCEKHKYSCSERLRTNIRSNSELELKNHDFWTKNVPDCSKSFMVMIFDHCVAPKRYRNPLKTVSGHRSLSLFSTPVSHQSYIEIHLKQWCFPRKAWSVSIRVSQQRYIEIRSKPDSEVVHFHDSRQLFRTEAI